MFGREKRIRGSHIAPELLSAYLDKEVAPQEHQRVEAHLRACEDCAQEEATLRYTKDVLCVAPSVPVPRAFTLSEADVQRSARRRRARRLSYYLQGASAAIAALLVVVVVGDVLSPGRALRSTAPAPVAQELPVEPMMMEEGEAAQADMVTGIAATVEAPAAEMAAAPLDEEAIVPSGEVKALSVTPEEEMLGLGGGGGEEQPLRLAPQMDEEGAPPLPQEPVTELSALKAEPTTLWATPELVPSPPPPTATPEPLLERAPSVEELLDAEVQGWTLSRILEVGLGVLFVVLVSLSVWLRKW